MMQNTAAQLVTSSEASEWRQAKRWKFMYIFCVLTQKIYLLTVSIKMYVKMSTQNKPMSNQCENTDVKIASRKIKNIQF